MEAARAKPLLVLALDRLLANNIIDRALQRGYQRTLYAYGLACARAADSGLFPAFANDQDEE